jgi:hypothetical protein
MVEELKSSEVRVTVEDEKVQIFTLEVLVKILPIIDDSDPFLTLIGTLSILCNRIKEKNGINEIIQDCELQIKTEDKYFN